MQPGLGRGPWKSERGAVAVAPGSAPPTVRPTNKTAAQLLRERLAGIRALSLWWWWWCGGDCVVCAVYWYICVCVYMYIYMFLRDPQLH